MGSIGVFKGGAILGRVFSPQDPVEKVVCVMLSIEALLASLRAEALERKAGWVEEQVRAAMPHLPPAAAAPVPGQAARRSRPPERLSLKSTPRARRCRRSPSRDPPVSASERPLRSGGRVGRTPCRWPSLATTSYAAPAISPLRWAHIPAQPPPLMCREGE